MTGIGKRCKKSFFLSVTRNYGGSTYLVCGTRTGGMPYMGTTNGWSCIIARNALVYKFFPNKDVPMIPEDVDVPAQADLPNDAAIDAWDAQYGVRTVDIIAAAGDDRAMFYAGAGGGRRTMDPSAINSYRKMAEHLFRWSSNQPH